MVWWWIAGLCVVSLLSGGWWISLRIRRASEQAFINTAMGQFHQDQPRLEAVFLEQAAATGRPRGLRWVQCQLSTSVAYALSRADGSLWALAGVTVRFEAEEGGPMEDVEAVADLRAGTALFLYRDGVWTTPGRTIFNLSPQETLSYHRDQFEPIDCPNSSDNQQHDPESSAER